MSILNREGSVLDHIGSHYTDIDTGELLDKIRGDLHEAQQQFFDNQTEIVRFASTEWGVSSRTVDSYMQDAREILKQDFDIDRRQFTAEVLAQYASLAKEARKSGQLTVALGCINSMAKVGQVMS